jgi:hypothetical protein
VRQVGQCPQRLYLHARVGMLRALQQHGDASSATHGQAILLCGAGVRPPHCRSATDTASHRNMQRS